MKSPLILLTGRIVRVPDYDEVRVALDLNWEALLRELSMTPLIIMPSENPKVVLEELKPDGIVFTGGNDLSSLNDNAESRLRDDFERKLFDVALQQNIPSLTICRGTQLVGELYGLSLAPVEGHIATEHPIVSSSDNPSYSRIVNSYHRYGLSGDATEIEVLAKSTDDYIEAFTLREHRVLSWMWHPERSHPSQDTDKTLIRGHFTTKD